VTASGAAATVTLTLTLAAHVGAQAVIAPTEQLAFDRPESWALQYFTSVSFLTGLGTVAQEDAGSISLQLESGWIPKLTADQGKVGFAGTADEDLNKAPVFFRPRVRVALPGHLAVIAAGNPPVRTFGITPRLAALALEWRMVDVHGWRLTWHAHGQTGTVTGAFTCPVAVLTSPPGSSGNPTGCETQSSDVVTLRYGALDFDAAYRIARASNLTPHLSVALNGIDSHFQVNAHTFGNIDRTSLYASGATWSVTGGAALPLGSRAALGADVFYTPLEVRRTVQVSRTTDGLFNVRGVVSYRIHY
jgi:hypothetical protein